MKHRTDILIYFGREDLKYTVGAAAPHRAAARRDASQTH